MHIRINNYQSPSKSRAMFYSGAILHTRHSGQQARKQLYSARRNAREVKLEWHVQCNGRSICIEAAFDRGRNVEEGLHKVVYLHFRFLNKLVAKKGFQCPKESPLHFSQQISADKHFARYVEVDSAFEDELKERDRKVFEKLQNLTNDEQPLVSLYLMTPATLEQLNLIASPLESVKNDLLWGLP